MSRQGSFTVPPGFRDSRMRPIASGEVVASTYMIRDEIARTEDGIVFEARDMMMDRPVAFKLAWRDPGNPSLIAEARRIAAVRDVCAVQLHGMGAHNGVEFAVGERVTGKMLREELAERVPPDIFLARLRTLASAVTHAHEGGVAVGQLSGDTVLLAPGGRLVLGRLSLSQLPAFGVHGQLFAPELTRREADPLDPDAAEKLDLYALGCIAVEMALGRRPFADENSQIEAHGHAIDEPPHIGAARDDLPSEVSYLADWLLEKQPAERPRSARDVLLQVDAIIERRGAALRSVRVLIVDDDTSRARWLWSLVRRAHASAIAEISADGSDAAHKLHRDQPDLVLIDASLRGVMNALELCMYARGLEGLRSQLVLMGDLPPKDRAALAPITVFPDDAALANNVLDRIRAAAAEPTRRRKRTTIVG